MKRMPIKIAVNSTEIPRLEIGDDGRLLTPEFCQAAAEQTRWVRGYIVFADESSTWGECKTEFGESIYRIGKAIVEAIAFVSWEYFAPKENG